MKQQRTVIEYIHQIDKVYIRRKCNRRGAGGRAWGEVNRAHAQSAPIHF